MLYLSIHRNSKLFCQECFLYVTVETKKPAQAPMYLSAQWLVDRDIIYLKNNEEVEFDGGAGLPRTALHHRPAGAGVRLGRVHRHS